MSDFDGTHLSIPFTGLHKARLQTGLRTALQINGGILAPEGVGDVYQATDALELYLCRDGFNWELFTSGGGGGLSFAGTRRFMGSDITVPGDDSSSYLNWTDISWTAGDGLDWGSDSGFSQPLPGFYEYSINLVLENTAAGRWHLEFSYDYPSGFIAPQIDFHTDGSGGNVILSWTDIFYALKGEAESAYAYFYLYQDSGSDQVIRAYSSVTFKRIGEPLS